MSEDGAGPAPRVVRVEDLRRMPYAPAFERQRLAHDEVLAAREQGSPLAGVILLVEHDPVITMTRRAAPNLIATPEQLARAGVEVAETDRGGDITYHGPGQLVVYPILDLQRLGWNLHRYMRELEQVVIDACAGWGLEARRDPGATGVWVGEPPAKVCAMGVRIRRWVTMHGLAINVTTNLAHFDLIVPCGLPGRPVTSLQRLLGAQCPPMDAVKRALIEGLSKTTGLSSA